MKDALSFIIKEGKELSDDEVKSIDAAKLREWKLAPMDEEHINKHIFVLLKDKSGTILAQAQLLSLNKVRFKDETFSILGIGGVIANIKGKGYGKKLMQDLIKYLKENNKIGVGFTGGEVVTFYKKCGFHIDYSSLKRFISFNNGQKVTNKEQECILYIDPQDIFMKKVLNNPEEEVILPRDPDW